MRTARHLLYSAKKISFFLYVLLLVPVLFVGALFLNLQPTQAVNGESHTDEVIVKYRPDTPESEKAKLRAESSASTKEKLDKIRAEVVKVPEGKVDETIKRFEKNKHVEYAEPNFIAHKYGTTNDPSLSQQWGLFKINAANSTDVSAWNITSGSASVKIAILDTGVEATHTDLAGKVVGEANFTTSPTISDVDGHGTHTAGIAAASTNNGVGIAGAGYNSSLLNGKVLGDTGSGSYSWVANGIIWAADNGAQVISMSLGGSSSSLVLQDAVNYAWDKGAVVVAAAGNNGNTSPNYPGYYTNAIAVAATTSTDAKASYSSYGSWVDVAAPGSSIYSTYVGNSYTNLSGTSMATPMAAGVAALIWAKGDCTTNTCVRNQLQLTADKISGTGTYWTHGRINAYKAVGNIVTITPTPVPAMTVSDITMSYAPVSSTTNKVTTVITVKNAVTNAAISSASVSYRLTTPSGLVYTGSGSTNSSGKVTFNLRSKEKGTFTATVTNVTKSSFIYAPTLTTKTLNVQ